MEKFSLGDFAINRSASENKFAGLSESDLRKNRNKFFSTNEDISITPDIKNVIPIQYNTDGSLKYTFDNIYKNIY